MKTPSLPTAHYLYTIPWSNNITVFCIHNQNLHFQKKSLDFYRLECWSAVWVANQLWTEQLIIRLKTDELEKPLFIATYLKGVFEISNKHELPLCVAIYLQSNQLISNFDFHEFSTWLQIVKSSLSYWVGTFLWVWKTELFRVSI